MKSKTKILILGGAGFIGSNITEHFYKMNSEVTVIDGLLENTGGNTKNLDNLIGKIRIIFKKIEEVQNLEEFIIEADLIIDCMAWTKHIAAIENPIYDLELNCKNHLHLINNLKKTKKKNIILLSSSGIYGNSIYNLIDENSPFNPVDIQGVHKLTAENYFKIYSKIYDFNIIALRIPNCFGINQPTFGVEIGLIGSFIRDALFDNVLEIFGKGRMRSVIYVDDVVEIIWRISQKQWCGFIPFNVGGYNIQISELAEKIITIAGRGKILYKEVPKMVKNIDVGKSFIDESQLTNFIGKIILKDIDSALTKTINYFKENIN